MGRQMSQVLLPIPLSEAVIRYLEGAICIAEHLEDVRPGPATPLNHLQHAAQEGLRLVLQNVCSIVPPQDREQVARELLRILPHSHRLFTREQLHSSATDLMRASRVHSG